MFGGEHQIVFAFFRACFPAHTTGAEREKSEAPASSSVARDENRFCTLPNEPKHRRQRRTLLTINVFTNLFVPPQNWNSCRSTQLSATRLNIVSFAYWIEMGWRGRKNDSMYANYPWRSSAYNFSGFTLGLRSKSLGLNRKTFRH